MAIVSTKPRIVDNDRLTMFTPCPTAPGKYSKLSWGIRNGSPRLTVFTNDPSDVGPDINAGVISAPLDTVTMTIFLNLLEKLVTSPEDTKYMIECKTSKYVNNIRTDEIIILSELWFGKDINGFIWISIIAPNRPKIKFTFKISNYYGIYRGDGNQITEAESSGLAALAYVIMLKTAYASLLADGFRPVQQVEDAVALYNKQQGPDEWSSITKSTGAVFEEFG